MPQPKSTKSSGSKPNRRAQAKPKAAPASPPPADGDERAQLARFLNPLDLVLLTRERIQEAVDDAVERGRMTRADATELAAELLERGRRQTEDLLADIEQLLGRSREQIDDTTSDVRRRTRKTVTAPADRVLREVDRARRVAGIGTSFPISGYDELTAAQVTGRLGDLTPAELRKVRDHERKNANRKSVLAAVEQKLG